MFKRLKRNKLIKSLKRQIDANDSKAMYDLAMIYIEFKKDKYESAARDLVKKSAALGYLPAKAYLATSKLTDSVIIGANAIHNIKNTMK